MDAAQINTSPKSSWKVLPTVKHLQKLSEILGISVPDLYNYKGLPIIFIIYGVFLCILQLVALFFSIYVHVTYIFMKVTITFKILTIAVCVILTCTNIVAIVYHIFIKRKKLVKMVKVMENIEKILQERFQEKINYNHKTLTLQTLMFIPTIILVNIYDFYATFVALQLRVIEMFGYSLYYFQILTISVLALQIHFYCSRIKTLFKFTHSNMRKTIHPKVGSTVQGGLDLMSFTKLDVLFFLRKYEDLCDVIDAISDIYGFQILLVVCNVIFNILQGLNLLLKVLMTIEKTEIAIPTLLMTTALNIIEYIIIGVILTVSCGNTAKEARKTSTVSYKILLSFSSYSKFAQHKIVKEELMLLAEHIRGRHVQFSTGFFPVDYNILFLVLGCIATYLIIILQFP